MLGTSATCFHGNGLKLAPRSHYRNHRTPNNILSGISCPEIEAMRAGISFRRAPNIWKKGTRYSLSSSNADTESNENAPFCHVLCCRPALSRASIKFKKQRGQGDYPGSFHHLSYSQRRRSFEIFTTEEGWPGLRRSAFSSWLCHRLPLWASVLQLPPQRAARWGQHHSFPWREHTTACMENRAG